MTTPVRTHAQLTRRSYQCFRDGTTPWLLVRRAARAGGCPEVWVYVGNPQRGVVGIVDVSKDRYRRLTGAEELRAIAEARYSRGNLFDATWDALTRKGTPAER